MKGVKHVLPSTYPLRKCTDCGKEAYNLTELEQFRKGNPKDCKYGRYNLCKRCGNARLRINGRFGKTRKKCNTVLGMRKIRFKEKKIVLEKNPRTNICSLCGKKYPHDLQQQTTIHHIKYDQQNPLAYTIEVCNSCHIKIHHKLRLQLQERGIKE